MTAKFAKAIPLYLIIAAELTSAADIVFALFIRTLRSHEAVFIFAAVFALLLILHPTRKKALAVTAAAIALLCLAVYGAGFLIWKDFTGSAAYEAPDHGKAELFADKNVMLIAPHEDDDLCILGGAIEEFENYGSRVSVVFVTNGDIHGPESALSRMREAMAAQNRLGVENEDIYFLGYGDSWKEKHIYAANNGETVMSAGGMTETYGTEIHDAYRAGRAYTKGNLVEDIESIILEISPDMIFVCDNDYHDDHVGTSLAFETAMGRLLHENADYKPLVFKGFSYYQGYYGAPDFYDNINLMSAVRFDTLETVRPEYDWEARFRLPVDAGGISHAIKQCTMYKALSEHVTQSAFLQAQNIINSDKVFWQRRTDSLCTTAEINVSSGEAELLTDFKYGDAVEGRMQCMNLGVWSPDDADKTLTVSFEQGADIYSIVLYDAKALDANILDAEIRFDNGRIIHTGALNADGSGNTFEVEEKNIREFTVKLLETEGEGAGLTEIEAFETPIQEVPQLIKIIDADENFVYDYCIDESGTQVFGLYSTNGCSLDECTLEYSGSGTAEIKDGELVVSCPKNGSECTVTLTAPDGINSDTVRFVNRGRLFYLGQAIDEIIYYRRASVINSVSFRAVDYFYIRSHGKSMYI